MERYEPGGDEFDLSDMPVVTIGRDGPLALLDEHGEGMQALLGAARAAYGGLFIRFADGVSRRWLARTANPHAREIAAVGERLGRPGAHFLNLSYEWGCTSAVAADPAGPGLRLIRTLDWPLAGLGRHAVIARCRGDAGPYDSVTWPGYSGVLTASAPGRFAAAINQAPMHRRGLPLAVDWTLNRFRQWRETGLPPAHLLRAVFETCASYAEARDRLEREPICLPAIFALAGTRPGEGCVIERRERAAIVHEAPACIANHWLSDRRAGQTRRSNSEGRLRAMAGCHEEAADEPRFSWLVPPILNDTTRLAVSANPARGVLHVQGLEAEGAVTRRTTIAAERAVAQR